MKIGHAPERRWFWLALMAGILAIIVSSCAGSAKTKVAAEPSDSSQSKTQDVAAKPLSDNPTGPLEQECKGAYDFGKLVNTEGDHVDTPAQVGPFLDQVIARMASIKEAHEANKTQFTEEKAKNRVNALLAKLTTITNEASKVKLVANALHNSISTDQLDSAMQPIANEVGELNEMLVDFVIANCAQFEIPKDAIETN